MQRTSTPVLSQSEWVLAILDVDNRQLLHDHLARYLPIQNEIMRNGQIVFSEADAAKIIEQAKPDIVHHQRKLWRQFAKKYSPRHSNAGFSQGPKLTRALVELESDRTPSEEGSLDNSLDFTGVLGPGICAKPFYCPARNAPSRVDDLQHRPSELDTMSSYREHQLVTQLSESITAHPAKNIERRQDCGREEKPLLSQAQRQLREEHLECAALVAQVRAFLGEK